MLAFSIGVLVLIAPMGIYFGHGGIGRGFGRGWSRCWKQLGLPQSGWPTDVLLPALGPLFGRGLDQVNVSHSWVGVVPGFLCCLVGRGLAQDVPFGDGVASLIFVDDFGIKPSLGCEEMLKFFKFPAVGDPSSDHMRWFGVLARGARNAEVVGSSLSEV